VPHQSWSNTITYLYLTARTPAALELAAAECVAVTGCRPDGVGIALEYAAGALPVDISRTAYTILCLRVLARAASLPDLYQQLPLLHLSAEQFRVSILNKSPVKLADPCHIMQEVGEHIGGSVNLRAPQCEFMVLVTADGIWFGEVCFSNQQCWKPHEEKLHMYSSALQPRIARALVNLVARPGDRLLDPCCGCGTVLIEAASMGISAAGSDQNYKLVQASIKNLRQFHYQADVQQLDACERQGQFDAVIIDLPYGQNCRHDAAVSQRILANMLRRAPRVLVVAHADLSQEMSAMGYRIAQRIAIAEQYLTRYVHVAGTR